MWSPASAIEPRVPGSRLAELVAASSIEISPRELHRAGEVAANLPANTCVYVPSLPGLPFARTLEVLGAIRAAGLDPVPHVSARRVPGRQELRDFLARAVAEHGVHRVMLIGGDERSAKGPYRDSLEILAEGVLSTAGVREIGVAGYPEGHPAIPARELGISAAIMSRCPATFRTARRWTSSFRRRSRLWAASSTSSSTMPGSRATIS